MSDDDGGSDTTSESITETTIASTDSVIRHISPPDPDIYLPIYVMTGVFGGIFILAPLFVRKGPNQGLIRCCIWITTFCFWVLWFTVYVAQMNPLIGPRLKNTTVAWLAHSWGQTAAPLEEDKISEEESGEWDSFGIGYDGRESGGGVWSGGSTWKPSGTKNGGRRKGKRNSGGGETGGSGRETGSSGESDGYPIGGD